MAGSLNVVPRAMKAALRVIYPPQCLSCGVSVGVDGALCPDCWRECEFISGCICDCCGVPLPGHEGEASGGGASILCDDCLVYDRPWEHARAAFVYGGVGRGLVLALKHGDRPDLARPLGQWLAQAAAPLVRRDMLVLPVPLHPRRLLSRKFNQAALLSAQVAARHGLGHSPAMLNRIRATPAQDHKGREERTKNLSGAFRISSRQGKQLVGRPVLLVDDVMASGATLAEATRVLRQAGAGPIFAAVVARAVKD
ncbi:ComF family protein [Paracoccus albus]|uniref:ComF family protein n=1 Tax=Paracoccus albus TaxID=3017784 RepID=UPI0022F11A54|nr:ComF family protein [Paracoccus albus]WBU59776.1 ComF family protein [Paracoccus albus]